MKRKSMLCPVVGGADQYTVDVSAQIRTRLTSASRLYTAQDAKMRRIQADELGGDITHWIHGINAQSRLVFDANRDYRAIRLEYIQRLLVGLP